MLKWRVTTRPFCVCNASVAPRSGIKCNYLWNLMASAIEFKQISKQFMLVHDRAASRPATVRSRLFRRGEWKESFWALRDVSFSIAHGETVGLIGSNGSGKSTILKMISGIISPTSGSVKINGRVTGLLELGAGFHPDLSGRDNIALNGTLMGLSGKEIDKRTDNIIEFSGLAGFIDTPVKHYSSGMYMRLGFSVSVHFDPEIFLIDEVLAVGDQAFQQKCNEHMLRLRRKGITIVFVSHDLDSVARLCSRAIWLDHGRVRMDDVASRVTDAYYGAVLAESSAREADTAWSQNRLGSGEARVTDVEFLGEEMRARRVFLTNEPMIVRVHYHADQTILRPMFGLAFHHAGTGTHLAGPNNIFGDYEVPNITGLGHVDYRLDQLPFLPGDYLVSTSIYDGEDTHRYDFWHQCARFTVLPGGTKERYGLIALEGSWHHRAAQPVSRDPSRTDLPELSPARQDVGHNGHSDSASNGSAPHWPRRGAGTRLLIISHDQVGSQMAGPGIRYWEMANALSAEFDVALAVPDMTDLSSSGVSLWPYRRDDWATLEGAWDQADAILYCGDVLGHFPFLKNSTKPMIVDGYDIAALEQLVHYAEASDSEQLTNFQLRRQIVSNSLQAGDFFICATERQRDWWLGALEREGRLTPQTYAADPTFRRLIDVVPYGCPSRPITHKHSVMRNVLPNISAQDRIVLWGGGVWPWMDPFTAIRAAAAIAHERSDVKLVFPGTRHPARSKAFETYYRARALADELELTDRVVYFGDWVAYADWENYLSEANIGISLHHDHIETRFSARSRLLSYIWGGLPMVLTKGDDLSAVMSAAGVASTVDERDVSGVVAALTQWLARPVELQPQFAALREICSWKHAVEAVAHFCRAPYRAVDKTDSIDVALGTILEL